MSTSARYARCVEVSRRVRWDIDRDVIRGRALDFDRKFLPDGLARVGEAPFLSPGEARFLSQVQGRTYANLFRATERYIGAKLTELGREHALGDPSAFEALVRFTDEEIKHQELFRRVEALAAAGMPPGYRFRPDANAMAASVLGRSTWAVLAFTLHIELYTQAHYRASIEPDPALSALWKDVFLFHWKEESQHAILDELEWRRVDAALGPGARDAAVDDLAALIASVDDVVLVQAMADTEYFLAAIGRTLAPAEAKAVQGLVARAYRWQYIVSGIKQTRFMEVLASMTTPAQLRRVEEVLAPIVAQAGKPGPGP